MTEKTYPAGVVLVDADAPREAWLEARADQRVTASEIHEIATGGIAAWRSVLDRKLNGSTFRGNRHTRRGHEREALLIDFAATIDPSIEPNGALWAAGDDARLAGTPDGIGAGTVAEVKSHDHGHKLGPIPAEHRAQMQWQMRVTGATRALYVREVMDEDGQGALDDPDWQWVDRDDEYIEWLESRATAFLAWWDADAPDVDVLDDETATALAEWIEAREAAAAPAKRVAAAKKRLDGLLRGRPMSRYGVQLMGQSGGVNLTAAPWTRVIDVSRLEDWERYGWARLRDRAAEAAAALADFEAGLLAKHSRDEIGGTQSLRHVKGVGS